MAKGLFSDILLKPIQGNTLSASDWSQQVYDNSRAIWAREDSAYQRMVEDMKKAGLNPWTGISSGGSPTSSVNPSMDALNSTLAVLMNNRDFAKLFLKGVDTTGKAAERLMNFFKDLFQIGGDLFKGASKL